MTDTGVVRSFPFIDGPFLMANVPPASSSQSMLVYVTDVNGGCYMSSNGTEWRPVINRRVELYAGTTDGSGNYTVVYPTPFSSEPHVNATTYPPADADTRVRLTASSVNGFTVRTEKNVGLSVLSLTVLGFGTSAVASVPVRVAVVGA